MVSDGFPGKLVTPDELESNQYTLTRVVEMDSLESLSVVEAENNQYTLTSDQGGKMENLSPEELENNCFIFRELIGW